MENLKLFSVVSRFWRMSTVIKIHDPCNKGPVSGN